MTGELTFKIRGKSRMPKLAESDAEIRRCFAVMKELHGHLESEDQFLTQVRRQQANEDRRLIYVEDAGVPVAAASFRISESLAWGKALFVDDLACQEAQRAKGFSKALVRGMEEIGRREGCAALCLESGVDLSREHRFYERIDYTLVSHQFQKKLV